MKTFYFSFVTIGAIIFVAAYFFGHGDHGNRPDAQSKISNKSAIENTPSVQDERVRQHAQVKVDKLRALSGTMSVQPVPEVNGSYAEIVAKLFHETNQCFYAARSLKEIRSLAQSCLEDTRPEFKESCRQETEANEAKIPSLQAISSACAERFHEADMDNLRYQAVVDAAKLGDPDAQACFVQSDFGLKKRNLPDQEVEQYQIDAISYVHQGFDRGDWRFPVLMATSEHSIAHNRGFLALVATGDDMTIYRMNRLLSLGATGDYATWLNKFLQQYIDASQRPQSGLTPEQLADEDAWAQNEYTQHFATSPTLTSAPVVCN